METSIDLLSTCTVPKVIDFPRNNMKCSGENVILSGIFHVVSRFPLHFILHREILITFLTVIGTPRSALQINCCSSR